MHHRIITRLEFALGSEQTILVHVQQLLIHLPLTRSVHLKGWCKEHDGKSPGAVAAALNEAAAALIVAACTIYLYANNDVSVVWDAARID